MPNKLTLLYFKIYYKKENYLKVRTVVFKYITPPYSKGWVYWCSVYQYIPYFEYAIFLYFNFLHVPNPYYILLMWLSYPSSYSSTSSISSIFYTLILTQYKSLLSTYTILFIRSITPTPFSLFLSSKNSVSKLLIRGVLYSNTI